MFVSQGIEADWNRTARRWPEIRKKLDVIPATAKLTPRPDGLPACDSLGSLVRNGIPSPGSGDVTR
jgi:hypothetical protein